MPLQKYKSQTTAISNACLAAAGRVIRQWEPRLGKLYMSAILGRTPVMDTIKITTWLDQVQPILIAFGPKSLGAIAVFVVGHWLINMVSAIW